jgi:hypothetical protein
MTIQPSAGTTASTTLNLFCVKEGVGDVEAFRVHIAPLFVPTYLASCFDRHREAHPAFLDFEDLDALREGKGEFETEEAFYKYWRAYKFKVGNAVKNQLQKMLKAKPNG